MAPAETADAVHSGPAGGGKRKRISSIISFVSDLERRLTLDHVDPTIAQLLTAEVQSNIRALQSLRTGDYGNEEIDQLGTNLWNLATRLRRQPESEKGGVQGAKLLLCSRVLAFLMLDYAQWSANESKLSETIHLTKLSMKASRACVDEAEYELGMVILQKAADYTGRLHDLSKSVSTVEASECRRLEIEYLVQRTALSWKQDRFDLAEHMYTKIEPLASSLDPRAAETVADVFFRIGKDLSSKQDLQMAVKWLDRAHDILDSQDLAKLSREAAELRLVVIQTLVSALLGLKDSERFERAQNLVQYVRSEIGEKPVVLLLELELLNRSPAEVFDADSYATTIRCMIMGFSFSESAFKLVIYHIRKLHDKSPGLGCNVLDEFLLAIRTCEHIEWVEKVVITRIWMTTQQRDAIDPIEDAQKVLSKVEQHIRPDAIMAAQALIWKKVESNYNQGQFELAARWCQLARCDHFEASGPINIAKIDRKLLLCHLAQNDLDAARSTFFSMSEASQSEPMTRYLLYKVAVRSADRELAAECLQSISSSKANRQFLYACVIDSHKSGDSVCAIKALKRLAASYDYESPSPVHLPALFRCTIRLLFGLVGDGQARDEQIDVGSIIPDLCSTFEEVDKAIAQNPTDAKGNHLFDIVELEWFCRNSYNLGLKHTSTWDLRHSVRMLTSCIDIIHKFPPDLASDVAGDLSLKMLFSHFMISAALTALARQEDSQEQQHTHYRLLRRHVAAFDVELQSQLKNLDEKPAQDLLSKFSVLSVFDFEAALVLEEWSGLGEIIRRAAVCKSVITFQAMGDSLLRSQAPHQEMFSAMRTIINELWDLEDFSPGKLLKYNRCLFQATLSRDRSLALHLVQETSKMVHEVSNKNTSLPREEIEWMATVAFNEGVDCYGHGDDGSAKQWAAEAMTLAHYCGDEGQLEAVLHQNYLKLKLGD